MLAKVCLEPRFSVPQYNHYSLQSSPHCHPYKLSLSLSLKYTVVLLKRGSNLIKVLLGQIFLIKVKFGFCIKCQNLKGLIHRRFHNLSTGFSCFFFFVYWYYYPASLKSYFPSSFCFNIDVFPEFDPIFWKNDTYTANISNSFRVKVNYFNPLKSS